MYGNYFNQDTWLNVVSIKKFFYGKKTAICIFVSQQKYITTETVYLWQFKTISFKLLLYVFMKEKFLYFIFLKFSLTVNALIITLFTVTIVPLTYILPKNILHCSLSTFKFTF